MTQECTRVRGINMAQGICDTEVPALVRHAAQDAIARGYNTYTRMDGLVELRAAIAAKLERTNELSYDAEREIVVTSGATGAFYGACLALLEPGDEVILFEPCYGYHAATLALVGAVARFVTLSPPSWQFSTAELAAQVGPRTKAIVLNTPVNPSGKVFTRAELATVSSVANHHDLVVITDEIYEHFVFDGREHVSPATLPGLKDRTITINGFSKTFSITGWRIGYSASPAAIAERLAYLNDLVYICAPAPLQRAVAVGLSNLESSFYAELKLEYQIKRDKLCSALATARLTPYVPDGAYYVLADVSELSGETSKERVMDLLKKTGIAAVPGSAFYPAGGGEGLARFCFGKTTAELDEACRRLEALRH